MSRVPRKPMTPERQHAVTPDVPQTHITYDFRQNTFPEASRGVRARGARPAQLCGRARIPPAAEGRPCANSGRTPPPLPWLLSPAAAPSPPFTARCSDLHRGLAAFTDVGTWETMKKPP